MNNSFTPAKTKKPQPKTPESRQVRDTFLTPRYATELLLPFINYIGSKTVWDVGAGTHAITKVLKEQGLCVYSTDIDGRPENIKQNFLLDESANFIEDYKIDLLVSNVPFSLKEEFMNVAFSLNVPFMFLMPFDMNGYLWNFFKNHGLQVIVPERRIDYITPYALDRANKTIGLLEVNKQTGRKYKSEEDLVANGRTEDTILFVQSLGKFTDLRDVPLTVIRKISSSDFHSAWFCGNCGLPKDFNFVELSKSSKDRIF